MHLVKYFTTFPENSVVEEYNRWLTMQDNCNEKLKEKDKTFFLLRL